MLVIGVNILGIKPILTFQSNSFSTEGICINFIMKNELSHKELIHKVEVCCSAMDWIKVEAGSFYFDLDKVKTLNSEYSNISWMSGTLKMNATFDIDLDGHNIVTFSLTRSEIDLTVPMKIFLSHKGSNKIMVRTYFNLLRELGFEPWLDEDAMVAGSNLDTSILQGFKDSCACVFFISPQFIDEDFLSDEIDYAITQKKAKHERFAIITLQFEESGKKGIVPEMLQRYVWKTPNSQFEAFQEIIKSLPMFGREELFGLSRVDGC